MRPLDKVIQATIKLIPPDADCRDAIVHDLNKVVESISYTAPEAMSIRRDQFIETLTYSVGTPDKAWKSNIAALVSGKLDYQEVLNA
jgi:hypothetical protein